MIQHLIEYPLTTTIDCLELLEKRTLCPSRQSLYILSIFADSKNPVNFVWNKSCILYGTRLSGTCLRTDTLTFL